MDIKNIDWNLLFDILKSISIIIASGVAIYGINSWRRETRWKRKYEIAEEVLSCFYEAQEAFSRIRFPGGYNTEGSSRNSFATETPEEKERLDRAYTTIERLNNEVTIFTKLDAHKFRFQSLFGEDASNPFIEFRMIKSELIFAANQLGAKFWNPRYIRSLHNSDTNSTFMNDKIDEFEAIIWQEYLHPEKDELKTRIDEAVKSIEKTCKRYLAK